MSLIVTDDKHYKNIADRIREENNIEDRLYPNNLADMIPTNKLKQCLDRTIVELTPADTHTASTIPAGTFESCHSLKTVSLHPYVVNVGNGAFCDCSQLLDFEAPGVVNLGSDAFGGCSSLKSMYLPSCLHVYNGAFDSCNGLQKLVFDSPCEFYTGAFNGTRDLRAIVLTNTSEICQLMDVYTKVFAESLFSVSDNDENGDEKLGAVYVPQVMYDAYRSATNWSAVDAWFVRTIEDNVEYLNSLPGIQISLPETTI